MDFNTLLYILEQTAQEKQLTILYVSLFALVMGMLVLDSLVMNKWTKKNDSKSGLKGIRPVNLLLFIILIIVIVALILLIVTKYGQ